MGFFPLFFKFKKKIFFYNVVQISAIQQSISAIQQCILYKKNTRMCCHSLLQRIFLTQGSNPGFLHCRQVLYHHSHQGNLQQCKSAIIIHASPPSLASPPSSPSHPSRSSQSTRLGSQCYTATSHQLSVLHFNVVFIELLYSNIAYWTTLFPPDFFVQLYQELRKICENKLIFSLAEMILYVNWGEKKVCHDIVEFLGWVYSS